MLKRPKPKGPMGLPGGRRKMPKPKRPRPPKSMLPKKPRPKLPSRKLPAFPKGKLTPEQMERLKKILPARPRKLTPEQMKKFKKLMPARKTMKKGGFPDLSGDGKVTKKDILMGRGVIKKKLGGPVSMIAKKGRKTIGMGRGGKKSAITKKNNLSLLIKKKKKNKKTMTA